MTSGFAGGNLTDRDGLYVTVLTTGTVSFRYNYRINDRQETLVLGRYGQDGITLSEARELLIEAKKRISEDKSPSRRASWEKQRSRNAGPFGEWAELWIKNHQISQFYQRYV
ncbi:Arm DNA-binding domain-containing protein [Nitrosomonas communis]|uniref:Arm DNA-binding domain-containing protein n=1 Tax=Nitrosomonas communis TaxID=44574 RepID=UPI0009F20A00|nr:Arm DNA-binding domain-containing protein [Nitrosomonas communis]